MGTGTRGTQGGHGDRALGAWHGVMLGFSLVAPGGRRRGVGAPLRPARGEAGLCGVS